MSAPTLHPTYSQDAPDVDDVLDSLYLPYNTAPIPESECTDAQLSVFIEQSLECEFSVRGYNQWMEAAGYPLDQVDPNDRLRLITLCHLAGKVTPQWQRLYDFDQPGILEAQHTPVSTNEMLQRNQDLKMMINDFLLAGMLGSDRSFEVFRNLMSLQDGGCGDQITTGLAVVNSHLNYYLNNIQRQRLCEHNQNSGLSDPTKGFDFWPDSLPADFAFDDAVVAAEALLTGICEKFQKERDVESVRSRLLKEIVLCDENRYWAGVAKSHSDVLANVKKFIPKNIADLELPENVADVLPVVRKLFGIDRRVVTKRLITEGRVLLDLYLHFARLEMPTLARLPHELAITASVALQMRRCKAKWPVRIHGQGTRNLSAYQAFKALAAPVLNGEPDPIDPALRVLLCGAVSMALWVESDHGMVSFDAVTQHGGAKVRKTEFYARIPKLLRCYSAPTAVRILQLYADALVASTPENPLDSNNQQFV